MLGPLLKCDFFEAATVTISGNVDGVRLDAEQHTILAQSLAAVVVASFVKNAF